MKRNVIKNFWPSSMHKISRKFKAAEEISIFPSSYSNTTIALWMKFSQTLRFYQLTIADDEIYSPINSNRWYKNFLA